MKGYLVCIGVVEVSTLYLVGAMGLAQRYDYMAFLGLSFMLAVSCHISMRRQVRLDEQWRLACKLLDDRTKEVVLLRKQQ